MVHEHCYRASLPSKYNFSFPSVILQEGFFYDCDVIGCYLQAYVGRCTLYMCLLKSALIHFVTTSNVYIVIHRDGSFT
jgi:hypothetical protein